MGYRPGYRMDTSCWTLEPYAPRPLGTSSSGSAGYNKTARFGPVVANSPDVESPQDESLHSDPLYEEPAKMDAIWLVRPAATDAQPRGPLPPVVAELHSRAVGEWRLRVGHFNDVHHAPGILPGESLRHSLDGWPAGSETVSDPVGPVQAGGLMGLIGQAAWLQERARRAGDDMFLLLGAGDDVTGGVLDVLLARAPKVKTAHGVKKGLHAAYTLYNRMGVHACAVGNHDLDRGVARLARAIEEDTRFPILAANLALGAEFADCIAPAAIFQRRGLCVGVIGVTTGGQLPPPAQRDVGVRDPVAAVVATARFLLPYTHVRIVLSHLGLTRDSLAAVVEPLGDRELAARLPSGGCI